MFHSAFQHTKTSLLKINKNLSEWIETCQISSLGLCNQIFFKYKFDMTEWVREKC